MHKRATATLAALATASLLLPAAVGAKPGGGHGHGKSHAPKLDKHGQGKAKRDASYLFKGVVKSADVDGKQVVVTVNKGNHHARQFAGQDVTFDVSAAKLKVADQDGNGVRDLADVRVGDKVDVHAKLPRPTPGAQPFAARKLHDKAHTPQPAPNSTLNSDADDSTGGTA